MKTIFAKALPDCGGGNIEEFELKHMKPNQAMNETQTAPLLQNTPASAVGIPRGHHNVTPVRINISYIKRLAYRWESKHALYYISIFFCSG